MTRTFEIAGQLLKPGECKAVKVPVTTDRDGSELNLWVNAVVGCEEGPALALLSALHGCEWMSVDIVRRVLNRVDPTTLRGTILAVPVGNPSSFEQNTRVTPDQSDSPDLNRSFGSNYQSISEQLAQAIIREVLEQSDCLVDYHPLSWGSCFGVVIYAQGFEDQTVSDRTRELAEVFGYPSLFATHVNPSTAAGYAGLRLGMPAITVEVGGLGFEPEYEEDWIEANVRGTINVMKNLEMIDGQPELPDTYLNWTRRWRLNPKVGGMLISHVGPERLLKEVRAGEVLGTVIGAATFEVLEELKSPGDGILYYLSRSYPVRPGDWAFGVIDKDSTR